MVMSARQAQQYGRLGEQSHVTILDRALHQVVGSLAGRQVLDFGCGEGRLIARLTTHDSPPARVVCIDHSPELLHIAHDHIQRESPGAADRFAFVEGDEQILPVSDAFDVVVCSLVLMMLETRSKLERAVAGLVGSLAPRGRAAIVLTHPCFRRAVHATFHNRLPPGFSYWQSGRPYQVVIDPAEQQVATSIPDYHWTLADYAGAITSAGGAISQMLELPGQYDSLGSPVGDPAYLVLVVTRNRDR